MDRDGPGFFADFVIIFFTYASIVVIGDVIVSELGLSGTSATIAALLIGVVIVFVVLLSYYRIFLNKRPLS